MNKLAEFLKSTGDRAQSANTKLDLLIYGVRDNASLFHNYEMSFKEEHYAFDNGNWEIDKKRLTPTEIILPGGIVSKIHIRPDSPLRLEERCGYLVVEKDGKEVSEFLFLPRPNFWQYTTSNGIQAKHLAQIYGLNCLNFNIFSGCEFQYCGKGCNFCSVTSTVDKENPIVVKKEAADLAEICQLATKYDDIDCIIITGGSYLDGDKEFQAHIKTIEAIKEHLPWNGRIKGNVSMMPPKNSSRLIDLYLSGVDNPSFNIEVWPREAFQKICPGKDRFVGFEKIISSLTQLVSYYGHGMVWSNFVAGLVDIEDMKAGFKFMAERGIIPGANIYHAEVNSVIGNSLGLVRRDYIRELYSYASELYHYYGYKPFFNASVLRNSLANEFYEGLLC